MAVCSVLSGGAVGSSLFYPDTNTKTDTPDETTLAQSIRQFVRYEQDRCQLKLQQL